MNFSERIDFFAENSKWLQILNCVSLSKPSWKSDHQKSIHFSAIFLASSSFSDGHLQSKHQRKKFQNFCVAVGINWKVHKIGRQKLPILWVFFPISVFLTIKSFNYACICNHYKKLRFHQKMGTLSGSSTTLSHSQTLKIQKHKHSFIQQRVSKQSFMELLPWLKMNKEKIA